MLKFVAAVAAGLYIAALVVPMALPAAFGWPQFSVRPFDADVQYQASLDYIIPMSEVFAQFGATAPPGGAPIVMGDKTADGVRMQMLDPSISPQEWQRRLVDGQPAIQDGAGAVRMISPTGTDFLVAGEFTTVLDGRKNNYKFELETVGGNLTSKTPAQCEAVALDSALLLVAGAHPSAAIRCHMKNVRSGKRAVLTSFVVSNGFLTPLYTDLTCALLHDAVAAKAGADVAGREHVCMALRRKGLLVDEENPIDVRHYRFSQPA